MPINSLIFFPTKGKAEFPSKIQYAMEKNSYSTMDKIGSVKNPTLTAQLTLISLILGHADIMYPNMA